MKFAFCVALLLTIGFTHATAGEGDRGPVSQISGVADAETPQGGRVGGNGKRKGMKGVPSSQNASDSEFKQKPQGRRKGTRSQSDVDFDEYAPTRSSKDEMIALSSKGFAWLTGSPADNDVQSVGKDAQFFGFVRFRYNSEHSVERGVIGRMLYGMLAADQRDLVISAAADLQDDLELYKSVREQILRGLEDHLYTGRDFDGPQFETIADLYGEADAELGLIQARAIAAIARSMSPQDRDRLSQLRVSFEKGDGLFEPEAGQEQQDALRIDASLFRLTKNERAYAEDLCAKAFTWLTGRPEDNETLPVGKPAQFFGFVGLRLKSQHSVKRAGLSRDFFELLNNDQQRLLRNTVNQQHPIVDTYLATRRDFLRELEKIQPNGDTLNDEVDESRLLDLGAQLGRLDVQIAQLQASTYTKIRSMLTDEQSDTLMAIRSQNVVESDELAKLSSLERGERLSHLCASCHKTEGRQIAPPLDGLFDRVAGTSPGFKYSASLQELGRENFRWTTETLNQFLAGPQRFAPGTAMTFKGLLHTADREALIEYLKAQTD